MENYLIGTDRDNASIFGLFASAFVSTFGVYYVLNGFFDSYTTLGIAIALFIVLLVVFDAIKRHSLRRYLNSQLMHNIGGLKVRSGYLSFFIMATVFFVFLDMLGSWSTASYAEKYYREGLVHDSLEYKVMEDEKEVNGLATSSFNNALSVWKENKLTAYKNCDDKWHGWKKKYKAGCKEDWDKLNPTPNIDDFAVPPSVTIDKVKETAEGGLSDYIFYAVFVLMFNGTSIMQFLTVMKIYNDFIRMSTDLQSTMYMTHVRKVYFVEQRESIERKKREIEQKKDRENRDKEKILKQQKLEGQLGDAEFQAKLLTMARDVSFKNEILQENYEEFSKDVVNSIDIGFRAEATHIDPIKDEPEKKIVPVKTIEDKIEVKKTTPVAVKSFSLSNIPTEYREIVQVLFKNGAVRMGEKLMSRDAVKMSMTPPPTNTKIAEVYSNLLGMGLVEKGHGYIAKCELR